VYGGYDQLPRWLASGLRANLRLRAPVAEIAWRRGHAQVTVRRANRAVERLGARAVIVTVPIGVLAATPLQPGSITLDPEPPRIRRACRLVAMGAVARVVCWFGAFPWSSPQVTREPERLASAGFLRVPGPTFGVWWTAYPIHWPLAVAWSGGPKAAEVDTQRRHAVESTAVAELAAACNLPRRAVTSRLIATWTHDWQRDIYSRGGYSYARVGGAGAARSLSRPVDETLFFAGEATDTGGFTGTVEGALASGLRVARQVSRVLGG
jgi:monoamine oxidase